MSKEAYHTLCQTEDSIPIFSQDWWLDIVCGKAKWNVFIIRQNTRIEAALPYYSPRPGIITMPPYTQTMGIWFASPAADAKYISVQQQRQSISIQLIEQLKAFKSFRQNFHHSYTDWLPFYWNGYRQTTRYTYLLPELTDLNRVWQNMSHHTRRNIRKAEGQFKITVEKGVPVEDFMDIQAQTFKRQHVNNLPQLHVLEQLIRVCRQRKQGEIWGGYDREGNLHAAVFIIWQNKIAYYLAGGRNIFLRNSGAHGMVLWEAIREVAAFSDAFDFEGSMLPGVERFFREFGGVQKPYFTISKGKLSLVDRVLIKFTAK